ncbi:hypothetical protein D3C81_1407650 [compost metagenome]
MAEPEGGDTAIGYFIRNGAIAVDVVDEIQHAAGIGGRGGGRGGGCGGALHRGNILSWRGGALW